MKLSAAVVAAMGITLAAIGSYLCYGQAQPAPVAPAKGDKRTITTSGTATVKVRPDSARVYFGVRTLGKTVKAAREESAGKVRKVMDALAALKIPDLKSKTSDLNVEIVESRRDGKADALPEILGYRVSHTFTVLVREADPEKLNALAGRVVDTALENGVGEMEKIVFFREDDSEARRRALTGAAENGVANAKALAAGGKVAVVETITIDGHPEFFQPYVANVRSNVGGGAGAVGVDPISFLLAGELEITCRVTVTCVF